MTAHASYIVCGKIALLIQLVGFEAGDKFYGAQSECQPSPSVGVLSFGNRAGFSEAWQALASRSRGASRASRNMKLAWVCNPHLHTVCAFAIILIHAAWCQHGVFASCLFQVGTRPGC